MRIFTRRMLAASVCVLGSAASAAPTVASATPSPAQPAGHIGGLVPVHGSARTSTLSTGSNMSYHNGPVMHSNTVYAIYWDPASSMPGNYESLINGFFANVSTAGGNQSNSNVYAIDTQYYDTKGSIGYSSTFGGSLVDHNPVPTGGCNDSATPRSCVTDAQIQQEIQADLLSAGWSPSPTNIFMMFTPPGVGSCDGSSSCAFTQYCAYHGYFASTLPSTPGTVYYANMPYTGTNLAACGTGQYPNASPAADSEISVVSHEQNETITDQNLNAWYDRRGYEIGDKCAWNFGTATGQSGAEYNQTIGSGRYYIQQEWSNKNSSCALTLHT